MYRSVLDTLQEVVELCDGSIYQRETSNTVPCGPSAVRFCQNMLISKLSP